MRVRVNEYVHLERSVFSPGLRIVAASCLTIQLATLTREFAVATSLAPSARFTCHDSSSTFFGHGRSVQISLILGDGMGIIIEHGCVDKGELGDFGER
jgi:hypothetical protein